MKSIRELRETHGLNPQEQSSSIGYFKKEKIDFDVYLPSIGRNLQRELVWTLLQKRELIYSIIIKRHIPHMAFICSVDPENHLENIWLVIDGKQRLSAMFDFVDDKFTIELEGKEYLFSQLPDDYKSAINSYYFRYYNVNEEYDLKKRITDEQKIKWFMFINFAGTPQDNEHMKSLQAGLK